MNNTDKWWLHRTVAGSSKLNMDEVQDQARLIRRSEGGTHNFRHSLYLAACRLMGQTPQEEWWKINGIHGNYPSRHPKFFAIGC